MPTAFPVTILVIPNHHYRYRQVIHLWPGDPSTSASKTHVCKNEGKGGASAVKHWMFVPWSRIFEGEFWNVLGVFSMKKLCDADCFLSLFFELHFSNIHASPWEVENSTFIFMLPLGEWKIASSHFQLSGILQVMPNPRNPYTCSLHGRLELADPPLSAPRILFQTVDPSSPLQHLIARAPTIGRLRSFR